LLTSFKPNDDREQDRMDLVCFLRGYNSQSLTKLQHHHIYQIAAGGDLFRAPVDLSKARVLDIGTGTGIWALDVAE
jgi:ubiquinone/menaquinone biosynthesis C-methylase UbiE